MKWTIRKATARGLTQLGWLQSAHTFSFGAYSDKRYMGFRSLRVINEDRVAAGCGFPRHPHRDMEIFSYVVSGALEHQDSLGNGRRLKPGEIQLMSAGSGVEHSEFNPSKTEDTHFLQIWIQPRTQGRQPSYTEWKPTENDEREAKVLVISPEGRGHSAAINQDVEVYRLRLKAGETVNHQLVQDHGMWLQVINGEIEIEGSRLLAGDGLSGEDVGEVLFSAIEPSEALLFDFK